MSTQKRPEVLLIRVLSHYGAHHLGNEILYLKLKSFLKSDFIKISASSNFTVSLAQTVQLSERKLNSLLAYASA